MNAISTKLFSISRASSSGIVQRNERRMDLTVLTERKGEIGKNGVRRKGGEKAECSADSAVGGCERYYEGPKRRGGLVATRGEERESIKSNVWWRYNEMNLCRAVMPEYLATLFWFCSWPDRHPSRYTVFELNSTTGPPLQGLKRPRPW